MTSDIFFVYNLYRESLGEPYAWVTWPYHVDKFCSHLPTGHSDQVLSKSDQAWGRRNKLWEEEEERRKKTQERNKLGEMPNLTKQN